MLRLSDRELRYARIAESAGMKRPRTTLQEAKSAGIGPALAFAMIEQETTNGANVFGHDPTIFSGAGDVTEEKYKKYLRQRKATGNKMMQGVGPLQLTWWEFQDAADEAGGCWRPRVNMRIGFQRLAALRRTHGDFKGIMHYNGSGPAAVRYALLVQARRAKWRLRLGIR